MKLNALLRKLVVELRIKNRTPESESPLETAPSWCWQTNFGLSFLPGHWCDWKQLRLTCLGSEEHYKVIIRDTINRERYQGCAHRMAQGMAQERPCRCTGAADNALNLGLVCLNDTYFERVHGMPIHQVWGKTSFCSFPVSLNKFFIKKKKRERETW